MGTNFDLSLRVCRMSWHLEMNRRRKERLAKQLQAVARPSEGPAATPGTSSLNSAGAAPVAPAILLPKPREMEWGELLTEAEVRALVDAGFDDRQIGKRYRRSSQWGYYARLRYGIRSPRGPGGVNQAKPPKPVLEQPSEEDVRACVLRGMSDQEMGRHFGRGKGWSQWIRRKYNIAAALTQGHFPNAQPRAYGLIPARAGLRDEVGAAFHKANGDYQSYTDADIEIREMGYRATALRQPRIINHTAAFCGDPAPNRPRA